MHRGIDTKAMRRARAGCTLVRLERELANSESGAHRTCGRPGFTDLALVRIQSLSREGRRLQRQRASYVR